MVLRWEVRYSGRNDRYAMASKRPVEHDSSAFGDSDVRPPQNSDKDNLKVGIFNSAVDSPIAHRIVEKLQIVGCETTRYDFLPAGGSKVELLEEFISMNDALLWIASKTSINDDGMMKAARHVGQFAAMRKRNDEEKHFITFQPKEYLKIQLPRCLDAYTPLKEDEFIDNRLELTLKRIRKKTEANRTRKKTEVNKKSALRYSEEGEPNLCAKPDRSDCTTNMRPSTETQGSVASTGGAIVINNHFNITNSNVNIFNNDGPSDSLHVAQEAGLRSEDVENIE